MSPPGSPPVRVVVTDTNILINLIHVGLLDVLGKLLTVEDADRAKAALEQQRFVMSFHSFRDVLPR